VADRKVHVTWQIKADDSSIRRLVAECDDEVTFVMFAGAPVFDESDARRIIREFGPSMVIEHRAQCSSCRKAMDS